MYVRDLGAWHDPSPGRLGAAATGAFLEAKKLATANSIAENLDALISAAKTGKSLLPDGLGGHSAQGHCGGHQSE
jgi:hypothetical protein